MKDHFVYRYYGLSEKGHRLKNEDAVLTLKLDQDTYFFAVADGMGGVRGGDIASNLVLETIMNYLKANTALINPEGLKEILSRLVDLAQVAIRNYVSEHEDLRGMGTTLVALLVHNGCYAWANIGDSRIYLADASGISRLSMDHNLLEDPGYDIPREQLESMPEQYKHSLTRVIDGGDSKPDIFPENDHFYKVQKDASWVLCSDGLIVDRSYDYSQYLADNLKGSKQPAELAERLVKHALESGSSDNVSVVIVKVLDKISEEEEHFNNAPTQRIYLLSRENSVKKRRPRVLVWIVLILVMLSLGLLSLYYFGITVPDWFPLDWNIITMAGIADSIPAVVKSVIVVC